MLLKQLNFINKINFLFFQHKNIFYDLGENTPHFSGEMNRQKLGLGQSEVTPVEMEIAKSAKQESRGFSHERFNLFDS